jgi:hypothetical protein
MFLREKPMQKIDQIKVFLQLDNFEFKNGIFKSTLYGEEILNVFKVLEIKLKQIESEKALSFEISLSRSRAVSSADLAHAAHIQNEASRIVDLIRNGCELYENPENAKANINSNNQLLAKHAQGHIFIDISKITPKNLDKLVFVSKQEKEEHSRLYK